MNSRTILALIIIFIIANGVLFYFVANKNQTSTGGSRPLQALGPNPNSINLPVALNHKGLGPVFIAYSFYGKVIKKESTAGGTKLTLDSSDPSYPQFLITKDVKVTTAKDGNLTPATADDIQEGSQVSINATFDLKTGKWTIRDVFIILPSASPTPSK